MEINSPSPELAREELARLSAGREQALDRMLLPWREIILWSILMNGCMIALVGPIVLSGWWTLALQGSFLTASWMLLVRQRRMEGVKRPELRIEGTWKLYVVGGLGFTAAFAVAVYARDVDNMWLGAAALALNFFSYLVCGGIRFLVTRQLNRETRAQSLSQISRLDGQLGSQLGRVSP